MRSLAKSPGRTAAPRATRWLEHLYEIGWATLSPVSGVAAMVEAVLAIAVQAVPMRSAVLIESRDSSVRLFAWRAPGEREERLAALKQKAAVSYTRVTGLTAGGVEERECPFPGAACPGAEERLVVIALALRGQPSFGVLQIEPARAFDDEDLAFLNAAANHISVALDRYYGRRRERALRRKAQEAEKEARRVSEDLERRVQERTARLEQMISDVHAFAYSIAHDLRAPVRHIHGYSEFLAAGADGESQRYVRRIMAAAERMDALIEDLLVYSRLTLEEVKPEPVEPSAVLARVLCGLGPEIESRQARLDVEGPLPRVMGHPVALAQILENLLSNALKFTPRGVVPVIRVRGEPCGDRVRLWVEDNGIGVEPAHQEKIFEVFQRLHRGEAYPGTGIGLAIVRRAAERLGGRAGVESEAGRGSRFWVELNKAV